MIKIEMERKEGEYGFTAFDAGGHEVNFDTANDRGGVDFGVRPMQSLLMALGACSGIDIVSILKKQKQIFTKFKITIEAQREENVIPALWKTIHLSFHFAGSLQQEKAEKACQLSIEKYCSVAETLRRAGAAIHWKVIIEDL